MGRVKKYHYYCTECDIKDFWSYGKELDKCPICEGVIEYINEVMGE